MMVQSIHKLGAAAGHAAAMRACATRRRQVKFAHYVARHARWDAAEAAALPEEQLHCCYYITTTSSYDAAYVDTSVPLPHPTLTSEEAHLSKERVAKPPV